MIDRNGSGDVDDAFLGMDEATQAASEDCEVLCHSIEKADYASYRLVDPWEVES